MEGRDFPNHEQEDGQDDGEGPVRGDGETWDSGKGVGTGTGVTLKGHECGHLDSHCSGTMPEAPIQYNKEGHMGREFIQPWTWQQDTMVLRDQGWGLKRDESSGNRSFLRTQA